MFTIWVNDSLKWHDISLFRVQRARYRLRMPDIYLKCGDMSPNDGIMKIWVQGESRNLFQIY